mgnify:CR=1 FL=1
MAGLAPFELQGGGMEVLIDMIRDFALKEVEPVAAELDETMEFPEAAMKKLADAGVKINCFGSAIANSSTPITEPPAALCSGAPLCPLASTFVALRSWCTVLNAWPGS